MIVLRDGTVVDVDGARRADVAVDDGAIVAVESNPGVDPDREIDVSGQYVAPGIIDAHVHLGLDGRADLIVLDDDPRTDVTAWQNPEIVVAEGRVNRAG